MAEYDLTSRMVPFFDFHLVIPLLEFIGPRKIYDEESLFDATNKLLLKTNMIDSVIESFGDRSDVVQELYNRRDAILEERERLKSQCNPIFGILDQADVKDMIESSRDREANSRVLEFLEQKYEFKTEMLDSLFKYAKFLYECGNYEASAIYLNSYRSVVPSHGPKYLNALYGKLASEILLQNWTHARDDMIKLRTYIDSNPFDSELELLQNRAWLLHWSLYIYFNLGKGKDEIIELFMGQQPYLNTIQIICPHLLRYLTVALVTSKTRQKNSLKDLIKIIEMERQNYHDPVTDFLSYLYIDFDFEEAQKKLKECESVLGNDFFLIGCLDEFRENARLLVFETFCRIHHCISLEMLAQRLNMDTAEAERWIVDLIRNYRIEGAKIDSVAGQVVISTKPTGSSIHEQVIETTKRLTYRTQQATLQIEKLKLDKKMAWKNKQPA